MDPLSILLFVVLFLLSGFFSGSEIAFMSLPPHMVESLIKQGRPGAHIIKKLKNHTERLLITILIGNNLVNVMAASLATKISIELAATSGLEQSVAIGISTGVVTLFVLIFGEIFPKTLATRYAAQISLRVAKLYQILQRILRPFVVSIEWLMKRMHRTGDEVGVTDEEIEAFIDMGHKSGVFEKSEYQKIKNILGFHEVSVQEVMTPRVRIEAIQDTVTVNEAIEKIISFTHSRIPVYHETIDDTQRVITLKELYVAKAAGDGEKTVSSMPLLSILKVPLTKPIHLLLELFRKTRKHVALVMDEYGGVAGIVTLEDVIEEVFGELHDETDQEQVSIKKLGNAVHVQSYVMLDDVLEHFAIDFVHIDLSQDAFGGETLSYFITSFLERFPQKGEQFRIAVAESYKDLQFTILSVQKNSVIGEVKVEMVEQ